MTSAIFGTSAAYAPPGLRNFMIRSGGLKPAATCLRPSRGLKPGNDLTGRWRELSCIPIRHARRDDADLFVGNLAAKVVEHRLERAEADGFQRVLDALGRCCVDPRGGIRNQLVTKVCLQISADG